MKNSRNGNKVKVLCYYILNFKYLTSTKYKFHTLDSCPQLMSLIYCQINVVDTLVKAGIYQSTSLQYLMSPIVFCGGLYCKNVEFYLQMSKQQKV